MGGHPERDRPRAGACESDHCLYRATAAGTIRLRP